MSDTFKKLDSAPLALLIDGVAVPIKSFKLKFKGNLKDATDSRSYDSTTQRVYRSTMPGRMEFEADADFCFYVDVTQVHVIDKMFSGVSVPLVADADQTIDGAPVTAPIIFGNVRIGDADLEFNVADPGPVTGTATLTSEGIFSKADPSP